MRSGISAAKRSMCGVLRTVGLVAVLLTGCRAVADEGSLGDKLIDPEDGMLDLTEWLGESYGFLPVPIIITEPAVGYGGGFALAFFHDSINNRAADAEERDLPRLVPPSISAAGGFYTENGSAAGGVFHRGVWLDNRMIYRGALFGAGLKLKYYQDVRGTEQVFRYDLDGYGTLQELLVRLGKSDLLVGPRYTYFETEATFRSDRMPQGIRKLQVDAGDGALGLALRYDALDNPFTPNKGVLVRGEYMWHDDAIGGDLSYEQAMIDLQGFIPLLSRFVAAGRCKLGGVGGDAPFYALPFVDLRGIPAQRYADDVALTLAADLRWDLTTRWSLVGFGGGGRVAPAIDELPGTEVHYAGGTGFRYLLARGFRLRGGLDLAFSEEDTVVYITVGNGWQ